MTKALLTIASGAYFQRMAALTHPTIRAYADKIGAEFIVWSDVSGYTVPQYKKMEIGPLLGVYDRLVYIDTDLIIRDDAPDIFDVVPADQIGLLEEGQYFERKQATLQFMERIGFNSAAWDGKYYNTGVVVCSACHRELFVKPPVQWAHFGEQTWFNTILSDRKAKVFPLPYRLNRMLTLSPFYGEDRLDSWFLHYAGVHSFYGEENSLKLIAHDIAAWAQARPDYKFRSHVAIVVEGVFGDNVAAEPVVRYARDVLYQGDNLVIVSPWPAAFGHLELPIFSEIGQIPNRDAYHLRHTGAQLGAFSRHQVHVTNMASLSALGIELPVAHRNIRLRTDSAAVASLAAKLSPAPLDSLVLVHPGRGIATTTFPPDVWESYVTILADHGFLVATIGQRANEAAGIVEFDRSKCIDLTDRISIEELIALLSQARVLLSNDASPVQIAGAFENWIGLIATLRHPEYVLPWRHGSQFYRAKSLERGELYRDYFHKPSGGAKPQLDVCDEGRLRECLPEPASILEFVQSAFAEKV